MEKTLSKHWLDKEIKGIMYIDGVKVIYLKTFAKRQWRYNDHLVEFKMDHINKELIAFQKWGKVMRDIIGQENFEK